MCCLPIGTPQARPHRRNGDTREHGGRANTKGYCAAHGGRRAGSGWILMGNPRSRRTDDSPTELNPPKAVEAERAAIACALIDDEAAKTVARSLRPEFLTQPDTSLILPIINDLIERGRPVDLVTVGERVGKADPDAVGYVADLSAVAEGALAMNVGDYCRTVREAYQKRRFFHLGVELQSMALDGFDREAIANHVEAELAAVRFAPGGGDAIGTYSAADLMGETFPEPKWAIPDVLPQGLTWLVGRPKIGKSWLGLDWALGVACGGYTMGTVKLPAGGAVYLAALEDGRRRMQSRIGQLLTTGAAPADLYLTHRLRPLGGGLVDDLADWLNAHDDARLVVVDCLGKVRQARGKNADVYQHDYEAGTALKRLADDHDVAVVVVHHQRKAAADDALDTVSGSTGLTGSADAVLILERERHTNEGTLRITGRDVAERELAMKFDGGVWIMQGDAKDVGQTPADRETIEALKKAGTWILPHDLADRMRITTDAAKKRLQRLSPDAPVERVPGGAYRYVERESL